MRYRQTISSTEDLAAWYEHKYGEMGGTWETPPEDCNLHLDNLGVPFNFQGTLLDLGCGGGHFLAEAEKRINETWGTEISIAAFLCAVKRVKTAHIVLHPFDQPDDDTYLWEERFDYIVSIGSLEHVIDLDAALDNVSRWLKPTGKWYFYVPNELWIHEDQPNERTMTDEEWIATFRKHGLVIDWQWRMKDNTAFRGTA